MTSPFLLNDEKATYKKDRVFRSSNGGFMLVKCSECEGQTVCYTHSQSNIKCSQCSAPILKSTGGMAKLLNNARSKPAENIY